MYVPIYYAVFAITLATLSKRSDACNGFVLKFHHLVPCAENNVIEFTNPGSSLDKDCNIVPTGCFKTSGFKTATIHYRAEKKPLPAIEGDVDLCKALENKEELAMIAAHALGLPDACPVSAQEICSTGDTKVNISKYKSKLGMALGVAEVNITITHDTGSSCLSLKSEFSKPRKMG